MEKTIITIVSRMEEKLGAIEAKLDSVKEDNANQHIAITRRMDIANGRLAKGELRDEEIINRVEKLEATDQDFYQKIEETNIIPITRWVTSNKHFLKMMIGFVLTLGAILSVGRFVLEDIFKITE